MYIYDDKTRLSAVLEKPSDFDAARGCPMLLIIHGFTGNKDERHIRGIAQAANEAGYATLRVDMYGHGESDGEFRDHTLLKWLSNAMASMDYIRSLEWVSDIYICGHSQGGLLVMMLAAVERDSIKGLISLSPGVVIPEGARKGYFPLQTDNPEIIPEIYDVWGRELCGNYIRIAKMINLDNVIAAYKGPVLMVHGDADETVPFNSSRESAEKYYNCKYVLIPGDSHCFDHHLDQLQTIIKQWLTQPEKHEDEGEIN